MGVFGDDIVVGNGKVLGVGKAVGDGIGTLSCTASMLLSLLNQLRMLLLLLVPVLCLLVLALSCLSSCSGYFNHQGLRSSDNQLALGGGFLGLGSPIS